MEETYYLYWIHRKSHKDIKTEGYVGVTNNPTERFKSHQTLNTGKHLASALKKYKDVEYDIVETFSTSDECLSKEVELRPVENVGWNMAKGGGMPPRVTKEAAAKISKTLKAQGANPYCENTNSKEAIEKRERVKAANKGQWWHNPQNKEYRFIKTAIEEIPKGWERGRVPAPVHNPKVRGKDYVCNAKKWKLDIDGTTEFIGYNIKEFLRENNLLDIYANLTARAKMGASLKSYKYKKNFKLTKV
jgi:predicted GIY-YIG superfamily endonuclease